MLVVLAVNSMDATLVEKFNLNGLMLASHGELSIPDSIPLHTETLWPSIITGVEPEEHGLTRGNARQWQNPVLQALAVFGIRVFPERMLIPLGKQLQKFGFTRQSKRDHQYYADQGIETVFTNRTSESIDVPGYSATGEKNEIRCLMGHDAYEPDDLDRFRMATSAEFASKRERLFKQLDRDLEILMCYIYSLDPTQHVFFEDTAYIMQWYEKFEKLTYETRDQMGQDDSLIIMSDHGMKSGPDSKGRHADYAFYASTEQLSMDNVLDFKPTVDRLLGP